MEQTELYRALDDPDLYRIFLKRKDRNQIHLYGLKKTTDYRKFMSSIQDKTFRILPFYWNGEKWKVIEADCRYADMVDIAIEREYPITYHPVKEVDDVSLSNLL